MPKPKDIKPTLLDYAILGLLQIESRSGYQIRKVFETTALGIYSSSPGTIYPALKRLESNALVERKSEKLSTKRKFQITQRGVQILKEWLLEEVKRVDVERKREELFLRFAFMEDTLTRSQKISFLKTFYQQLENYLDELKTFHQEENDRLPLHGRLSFEHGIASYEATLKWCRDTITLFQTHKP